jgi:hypothetical protein
MEASLLYLNTLGNHPLSKDDGSGCPITSQIIRLGSSLPHQFGSNILNRVLQLNLEHGIAVNEKNIVVEKLQCEQAAAREKKGIIYLLGHSDTIVDDFR